MRFSQGERGYPRAYYSGCEKIRQRTERERENGLPNDHGSTKEKVIHVVAEDCVDNANSIEIGKFGFGLAWSDRPFETKCVDDVLHTLGQPVYISADALSAFDSRSVWTIEDEEWEQGRLEQTTATKEERAKFWVLALLTIGRMEEPDGCINADAETTLMGRVGVKAILNSELGERTNLPSGA